MKEVALLAETSAVQCPKATVGNLGVAKNWVIAISKENFAESIDVE